MDSSPRLAVPQEEKPQKGPEPYMWSGRPSSELPEAGTHPAGSPWGGVGEGLEARLGAAGTT